MPPQPSYALGVPVDVIIKVSSQGPLHSPSTHMNGLTHFPEFTSTLTACTER